jgi:hypothetical protein
MKAVAKPSINAPRWPMRLKVSLKFYFPLALQWLDNDTSTALAADLLLK